MPIWLRKFTFSKIKEWYDTSKDNNNEESWISGEAKNEASKNKTDSTSYKDIAEIPEDYNVPGMRSAAAIASTPEKDKIQQYKVT